MVPRRTSRRRYSDSALWLAQKIRLQQIAAGKIEPMNDRERFFARLLATGQRPRQRDFILPRGPFLLEHADRVLARVAGEAESRESSPPEA